MKRVTKVLMFVWRKKGGKKEFLVLKRQEQKDCVALTGHLEAGESRERAVKREVLEELDVLAKAIVDLNFQITVFLKHLNVDSEEHGFLVEIPAQKQITFLEYEARVSWYSYQDLIKKLTYPNQRKAAEKIKEFLKV